MDDERISDPQFIDCYRNGEGRVKCSHCAEDVTRMVEGSKGCCGGRRVLVCPGCNIRMVVIWGKPQRRAVG